MGGFCAGQKVQISPGDISTSGTGWEPEPDSRLFYRSARCRVPTAASSSGRGFAALPLTLFSFFLATQSLDLLTKTRTLYFKTSSALCTTGRERILTR